LLFDVWAKVAPPFLVISTAAHHLHYAILNHPCFATINAMLNVLRSLSSETLELVECDSAYANLRLVAHWMNMNATVPAAIRSFFEWVPCSSHQNNLIEGSALCVAGMNLLSRLYSLAVFLRSAGNFVRLASATQMRVKAGVEFCVSQASVIFCPALFAFQ
jgi:hypothetical protein